MNYMWDKIAYVLGSCLPVSTLSQSQSRDIPRKPKRTNYTKRLIDDVFGYFKSDTSKNRWSDFAQKEKRE